MSTVNYAMLLAAVTEKIRIDRETEVSDETDHKPRRSLQDLVPSADIRTREWVVGITDGVRGTTRYKVYHKTNKTAFIK